MVRPLITLLILLFVGLSCTESIPLAHGTTSEFSGSGILASEVRPVAPVHSVHLSGNITTVISKGNSGEAVITADHNILQKVSTELKGTTLYISLKEGEYYNIWVQVQLSLPRLLSISNTGNGLIKVSGHTTREPLKVVNSGNGIIWVEGEGMELWLDSRGAGMVHTFEYKALNCADSDTGSGTAALICDENSTTSAEVDQSLGKVVVEETSFAGSNTAGQNRG